MTNMNVGIFILLLLFPISALTQQSDTYVSKEDISVLTQEVIKQQIPNQQELEQQILNQQANDYYKFSWYFNSGVNLKKEILCLAQNIYFESRGEPYSGQLAVGLVTINRLKTLMYPGTICGVVWQSKQFSWTHDGLSDRPRHKGMWEQAQEIANMLFFQKQTNSIQDLTNGATHFHATYVRPRWSKRLYRIMQIGNHIFYRLSP